MTCNKLTTMWPSQPYTPIYILYISYLTGNTALLLPVLLLSMVIKVSDKNTIIPKVPLFIYQKYLYLIPVMNVTK